MHNVLVEVTRLSLRLSNVAQCRHLWKNAETNPAYRSLNFSTRTVNKNRLSQL